jgi:hypothetical protein
MMSSSGNSLFVANGGHEHHVSGCWRAFPEKDEEAFAEQQGECRYEQLRRIAG